MSEKLRIFNWKHEQINLFFGAISLPLSLYFILWQPTISLREAYFCNYIVGFVFFNWTHTAFTIGTFWQIQAYKDFAKEQKSKFLRFYDKLLLIFIGIFIASVLFYFGQNSSTPLIREIFNLRILFDLVVGIGIYHVRRQTMGLSLLYNRCIESNVPLNNDQFGVFKKNQIREKIAFGVLSVGSVAVYFANNYFPPTLNGLLLSLKIAVLISGLFIMANALLLPHVFESNKPVYLLRAFVGSVSAWEPLSSLIFMALHGLEYYFVTCKTFESARHQKTFFGLGLITLVVAAIQGGLWIFSPHNFGNMFSVVFGYESIHPAFILVGGLAASIAFFHYYADGFLYRFRDSAAREHILPLVYNKNEHYRFKKTEKQGYEYESA